MAEEAYYLDGARNQQGPVPIPEIARLIRSGTIRRDTMVWYAGMPDWRPAGQVSDFAALFVPAAGARPPGAPLRPQGARPASPELMPGDRRVADRMIAAAGIAGVPTDRLVPQLAVWGLFWRVLVAALGAMLLIPTPWTNAALYRYLVGHTWLPDGRRLTFAGTGGDIWYVFIGGPLLVGVCAGLLAFLDLYWAVAIIAIPVFGYMNYLIVRWLTDKVGSEDGSVKLEFTGSFWGILGWHLLLIVSVVTIIGWAWVMKFFLRWWCRSISGTVNFDFEGTGWGILWRNFVVGLASGFLIPIPWVWRWYSAWLIGQVRVVRPSRT